MSKLDHIENRSEFEEAKELPLNQPSEAQMSLMGKTGTGISQASLVFGKSILNSNYKEVARSTIGTVDHHVGGMPVPKKYALAKKKKEKEEEKARVEAEKEAAALRGEEVKKSPKKKKVDKTAFPDYPPAPVPPSLKPSEAMEKTVSWNHSNVIDNKYSVGVLTTTDYLDKVETFMKMNQMAELKAPVYPPSNFFGNAPN